MDDRRFDRLTRAFARGVSRRQALGVVAGLAVAGAGGKRAAAQSQLDQSACAAGQTVCGGACVDLQTDMSNCGACGAVCESGLVAVACRDGQCVRADCPPDVTFCGVLDGCRDLRSDPLHCGACDNACAAGQACSGGVCGAAGACAPGQADCGGTCIDACCDNNNCGACGNVCPAGTTCFEGVCDCPSGLCCAEGEANCDGVCVATCCDNANCGACGNACPEGQTCFEGVCGCPSGLCDGGSGGSTGGGSGKPTQLPNTGAGRPQPGPDWTPLALAGAAATALAAVWRTRAERGG
ncbi:MAG TPA: hypothetical protein VFX03_08385 [Thermomicrobiales bacterium]|nr:hypothetical protein [Thermomicrobiales bacterium]